MVDASLQQQYIELQNQNNKIIQAQPTNPETKAKIEDLRKRYDKNTFIIISAAKHADRFDSIVKDKIIENAKILEERFILHGQQWIIDEIAAIIYRDLRVRGIPDSKANNVFHCLAEFGDKYMKKKDHSTITDLSETDNASKKRLEDFYKSNSKLFIDALKLFRDHYDPGVLTREDAQTIADEIIDMMEKVIQSNEEHKIALCKPKQDDFHGAEDKFTEQISYPKTIREAHSYLAGCMDVLADRTKKAAEIVREEGVLDPDTNEHMLTLDEYYKAGESFIFMASFYDSTLDRKWRIDLYDWFQVSRHAKTWFKHSAATAFKTESLRGLYRSLTREHIGARIPWSLKQAEKAYQLLPNFWYFHLSFFEKIRRRRGADFSIDLSPKLSDKALK